MLNPICRSACRQRGASAIEFIIVFPALFGLFWLIISYSIPFLMLQTFHAAAAEGARAAIGVPADVDDYDQAVVDAATETALNHASLLGPTISSRLEITAVPDAEVVTVRVVYPDYTSTPVVPIIRLPYFGDVPRLPADLVGQSSIRL